jgi:hypothetical protein
MTRVPQHSDPDSLEHVAKKVEVLHDHFKESKDKVRGVEESTNPFGDIRHPDELQHEHDLHPSEHALKAVHGLRDHVHGQFDAAADLMKGTSGALREAARAMRETELAAKDSITVKDGSLDV